MHVYAPQDVCREITTSTQGNGSNQLLYGGLYVYQQTNYEEQRLTDSQACRNLATSLPMLDANERLPAYKPIYILYPHAV